MMAEFITLIFFWIKRVGPVGKRVNFPENPVEAALFLENELILKRGMGP